MNSRERVLAAIRREPVDYVPCCGHFNPLTPQQRNGVWNFPWTINASTEEQIACQVEMLGLDAPVHCWDLQVAVEAPEVTSSARIDGDALTKTYRTPAGDLAATVRYNDLWPYGEEIYFLNDYNIGHFLRPWILDARDLACYLQIYRPLDQEEAIAANRARLAPLFALARRYALPTIVHFGMGLTGAMQLFGAEGLCLAVVDHPELVEAYLEYEHQTTLRAIEVAGTLGFDIFSRNGFYESADFYGAGMLEQFLGRRLRDEVAAAHRAGMATAYTIHTGLMPILDYLDRLPFDSFFGVDIAFKDMDIRRVRDRLAHAKAFWTGPSSTFHLWGGPDATRRAVREVFECFGTTGLILTPCVSAHSIMPWESTLAMIDEWKRLRAG